MLGLQTPGVDACECRLGSCVVRTTLMPDGADIAPRNRMWRARCCAIDSTLPLPLVGRAIAYE